MTSGRRPAKAFDWLEGAMGLAVLGFALYQWWFVLENGYLAQPFFYDTNDTLMDFYNTAYWAHTNGPYSIWNSIYPPLSFAVLQLVTPRQCYAEDPFVGRTCDPWSWLLLVLALAVLVALVWHAVRRLPWPSAWARVTAIAIGLPTLFCLERGNLLLLAAPPLVFGLLRRQPDWIACAAIAVAVSLKPYLVLLALPLALNHGWQAGLRMLAACAGVYLASIVLVGDGLPWQILSNVQTFAGEGIVNYWEKFYFSTSFSPFVRILDSELPLDQYLDSADITRLSLAMRGTMLLCLLALAAALLAARWLPAGRRPRQLVTCAVLTAALVVTESFGGYAIIFVTALLFTQRRAGAALMACLVMCYLLSIPFDLVLKVMRETEAPIWLTGREVEVQYGVALGQALRPALIALLELTLCGTICGMALRYRQRHPRTSSVSVPASHPSPSLLPP